MNSFTLYTLSFSISLCVSPLFCNVGSCMFALSASICTVSTKFNPSICDTNVITFPPTPHPKQWNICLSGETEKEGDFSL